MRGDSEVPHGADHIRGNRIPQSFSRPHSIAAIGNNAVEPKRPRADLNQKYMDEQADVPRTVPSLPLLVHVAETSIQLTRTK